MITRHNQRCLVGLILTGALGCDESFVADVSATILVQDIDFGDVPVGSRVARKLSVLNGGAVQSVLQVRSIDVDDVNGAFDVERTIFDIRGPGEVELDVAFAPSGARRFSAQVEIQSNARNDLTKAITLSGTGVAAIICGPCNDPPPRYCATDSVLVLYRRTGLCPDGLCEFSARTLVCNQGCESGLCIGDRPPSDAVVAIDPIAPRTIDDLQARIITEAIDPEGERVTYQYRWFEGGNPRADGVSTITSSVTARGQTWRVVVTPTDGQARGTPAEAEVTVANAPPTIDGLSIGPDPATVLDPLVAVGGATSDPDGDVVGVVLRWTADGAMIQQSTDRTLPAGRARKGQRVVAAAVPNDGTDDGVPVESNAIVIANSPPSIAGAQVDPNAGDERTTFRCVASGWVDADGDTEALRFRWLVRGATVAHAAATIDGTWFAKGDTLACEATPDDGADTGTPRSSAAVTIGNAPPSVASVVIDPATPTVLDVLTAVPAGWADPDGDAEGYHFAWSVGGAVVGTGRTLDGSAFARANAVTVMLTPFDGEAPGPPVTSAPVVVVNSPPSLAAVDLVPAAPRTDTPVTAVPSGYSDPDGDLAGYRFAWFVDGVAVPGATSATLSPSAFVRGQGVFVDVTPFDGSHAGPAVRSTTLTIGNAPPSITGVTVSPPAGTIATVFTCIPAGWSDADGDLAGYRYTWSVDGAATSSVATIDRAFFSRGAVIRCGVVPTDGIDVGAGLSSGSVTIANAPPSAGSVTILPAAPREADRISAVISGWQDADGDAERYLYSWRVGGVVVSSTTSIDGTLFDKGQTIQLSVTPFDGLDPGPVITSNVVTASNTPPSLATATIGPDPAYTNTDLTVVPGGWADPDPADSPAFGYRWLVNGGVSGTAVTLPSASFARGSLVRVEVTPTDGAALGPAVSSSEISIRNRPPGAPAVAINPTPPTTNDDLTCSVVTPSVDADGDVSTYTFTWLKNGGASGVATAVVPTSATGAGEQWTCVVTPHDGIEPGIAGTADVTIGVTAACTQQDDCGLNTNGSACPATGAGAPMCAPVCRDGGDCGVNEACKPLPGSASLGFCAASGAVAVGGGCSTSTECADGICSQGACRRLCQSQFDCAGAEVCGVAVYNTSELGGSDTRRLTTVCRPIGARLPIGSACSAGTSADTGLCATEHCDLPPWSAGVGAAPCSQICGSSDDCGAQQVCGLVYNGLAETPQLSSTGEGAGRFFEAVLGCYTPYFAVTPLVWELRPPGQGAIGAACDPVSSTGNLVCRSHVCAQFAPIRGRCTDFCETDSDCLTPSTPNWRCRFAELNLTGVFVQDYGIADPAKFVLVSVCAP